MNGKTALMVIAGLWAQGPVSAADPAPATTPPSAQPGPGAPWTGCNSIRPPSRATVNCRR
jgi:hypothetical protein